MADYLEDLNRRFGYFANAVVPMALPGIEGKQTMANMLDLLRSSPPREIGGLAVTGFDDLRREDSWLGPLKGGTDAAARNFLVFHLGQEGRIALRPSGTEPKAKAYVEVCRPPRPAGMADAEWEKSCRQVDELSRKLCRDFLHLSLGLVGVKPPQ